MCECEQVDIIVIIFSKQKNNYIHVYSRTKICVNEEEFAARELASWERIRHAKEEEKKEKKKKSPDEVGKL